MDVIVDGAKGFSPPETPADVMGMVVAVSDWLQEKGRAILSVKADGESLDADRMVESLSEKPLSTIGTLEIISEETSKLVDISLAELETVLPELPTVCHELAAIFQGADPQSGYQPFQQLADIWSHVKSRQKLVAVALSTDLDEMRLDGRRVGEIHEELNTFLAEAVGALESGDLILLGDLLEYELAPRAELETKITGLLREQVGG